MRFYPSGAVACHIIGYTGRDDPAKAEDRDDFFYYIPDYVGKTGLEKELDTIVSTGETDIRGLRGQPGESLVLVDSGGFIFKTLEMPLPPIDGRDIVLTINWEAQKAAFRILEEKKGAFVILNARTGAVIAMASSPNFDPNLFVPQISGERWRFLNTSPDKPLFDRALMGEYMPGSIIKPLIAVSLLENGFSKEARDYCEGGIYIGRKPIKCWNWKQSSA